MRRHFLLPILIATAFPGCGKEKESSFVGKSKAMSAPQVLKNPQGEGIPPQPGERITESFQTETSARPADFLFVIDNSCSMNTYKKQVLAGFRAVPADRYPPDSRMGVMTTMPADPENMGKVHVDVAVYPHIEKEPGFLALASQPDVLSYRKVFSDAGLTTHVAAIDAAFAKPMCQEGWFGPHSESTTQGVSCLEAAFQTRASCTGAEAGLTAVKQLMQKSGATPFFREKASIHIVLVSDTHDPGRPSTSLRSIRPDFVALEKAVRDNNPSMKSLKIHGVVPKTPCGEMASEELRNFVGFSYLPVIEASRGVSVDMCTQSDYTPVAKQIVDSDRETRSFALRVVPKSIVSLTVDGIATTNFRLEGQEVTVSGLDPQKSSLVEIIYESPTP